MLTRKERRKVRSDRRRFFSAEGNSGPCPLTPNEATKLEEKINVIYEKMVLGKGVILGMRLGAIIVFSSIAGIAALIYAFAAGKMSAAEFFSRLAEFL